MCVSSKTYPSLFVCLHFGFLFVFQFVAWRMPEAVFVLAIQNPGKLEGDTAPIQHGWSLPHHDLDMTSTSYCSPLARI